jgi:chromosome segregation ATPase
MTSVKMDSTESKVEAQPPLPTPSVVERRAPALATDSFDDALMQPGVDEAMRDFFTSPDIDAHMLTILVEMLAEELGMDVRDAVERCQPGLYPEQTMLRRQLDAKDQKIKELEESFRRQLGTKDRKMEELEKSLSFARERDDARSQTQRKIVEKLELQLDGKNKEILAMRKKLNTQEDTWSKWVQQLHEKLSTAERNAKEYSSEIAVAKLDLDETVRDLESANATITKLEEDARKHKSYELEVQNLTKGNKGLQEKLRTNAKVEADRIKAANAPLKAEVLSLNQKIDELVTQTRKHDDQLREVLREKLELKDLLAAATKKAKAVEGLERVLQLERERSQKLTTEVARLKNELHEEQW